MRRRRAVSTSGVDQEDERERTTARLETYDKFPFYFSRGVEEILVVLPNGESVEPWVRNPDASGGHNACHPSPRRAAPCFGGNS